jgi:hypothetical protein
MNGNPCCVSFGSLLGTHKTLNLQSLEFSPRSHIYGRTQQMYVYFVVFL